MAQNDEFEELRDDFAAKQAAREQRRLQKLWAKLIPIDSEITCRFLDPLIEGQPSDVECVVAGNTISYRVEPEWVDLNGPHKRRTKDYAKQVEKWATWKWHTARGTPVTDRDVYQYEPGYKPPTFAWEPGPGEEVAAPVAKRGPGRPKAQAAA